MSWYYFKVLMTVALLLTALPAGVWSSVRAGALERAAERVHIGARKSEINDAKQAQLTCVRRD
jgi:hypothetical protein